MRHVSGPKRVFRILSGESPKEYAKKLPLIPMKAPIRILEQAANRRGDLFARLMGDLFVALGYGDIRFNSNKPGREIDIEATHRLEPRRAIAECKATSVPVGGNDINKFVGILGTERRDNRPLSGYFVSLSGFTESAIEQERERRRNKIILVDGDRVVLELVQGRIIVSRERATELAGRLCTSLRDLILDPTTELLAHERGWIWAVYYTQGKERTHFALIHSDGTPLAQPLVDEVIRSEKSVGGTLFALRCINPRTAPGSDDDPLVHKALAAYERYLTNECGYIQLDGLPTDSDVGSRRLKLESLFVPLHLEILDNNGRATRQPLGAVLERYQRLAILAAPGGGKSTLIKRLAVSYADSIRREQITDDLPKRDWLPLFFRCRELRSLARGSFGELLQALSQREGLRHVAAIFLAHIDRALLAGRVLLLVDGLDEISDSGDRAAFVSTLRTALQAYPGIALVVTSREAGFRHVAAHLAPICTIATIAPFDESDILRLTTEWHREIVADTEKVRTDAANLARTISNNDRIRLLAVNPLLLTTLLLVRRWVGQLPTRRAVLYGEAVKVLIRTWNTEGYEPLPEEEAIPQLCYVASSMMIWGVQKISRPRLAILLQEARRALPTELGYVRGTVDEFIHRVEDRSSLLMMSGNDIENGQVVEFFEFRHLTFQEFLTARGFVEGWYPQRKESDTLASVLKPFLEVETWREVIPLAAVLGGKSTESLIQLLTTKVRAQTKSTSRSAPPTYGMLASCLADEAAARPETIRSAVKQIVRFGTALRRLPFSSTLVRGKYGDELRREAERRFVSGSSDFANRGDALLATVWWQTVKTDDIQGYEKAGQEFLALLKDSGRLNRCAGATGLGAFYHQLLSDRVPPGALSFEIDYSEVWSAVQNMLYQPIVERGCACFAITSIAAVTRQLPDPELPLFERLFEIWQNPPELSFRHLAARALGALPLISPERLRESKSITQAAVTALVLAYSELDPQDEQLTAIVLGLYYGLIEENVLDKILRMPIDQLKLYTNVVSQPTIEELQDWIRSRRTSPTA